METPVQSQQPQTTKPPMTAQELVDLRARVLRGEAVTDEELRHALSSLAMARGTAAAAPSKGASSTPAYVPSGSLADRFAAFKNKKPDALPTPEADRNGPQST